MCLNLEKQFKTYKIDYKDTLKITQEQNQHVRIWIYKTYTGG